ncbi:hypothetical protein FA09DRAFT_240047 [Tilletiopsis washingtonensis]|jgi:hypothetical protein|uniref:Uncharacterized protein n=1 Tax=Tilletiopsis washingtonensis TaxID=58919 RepID=A0A316ZBZ6_9BASI|nr:hypothetical protein FA09DRAFT_240047 [Tilletiopsis washingtonensis]PWN99049.1 hypothetical protein FA09DRAFT_240047 [Tilletiopsis washingtonensis]
MSSDRRRLTCLHELRERRRTPLWLPPRSTRSGVLGCPTPLCRRAGCPSVSKGPSAPRERRAGMQADPSQRSRRHGCPRGTTLCARRSATPRAAAGSMPRPAVPLLRALQLGRLVGPWCEASAASDAAQSACVVVVAAAKTVAARRLLRRSMYGRAPPAWQEVGATRDRRHGSRRPDLARSASRGTHRTPLHARRPGEFASAAPPSHAAAPICSRTPLRFHRAPQRRPRASITLALARLRQPSCHQA